MSGSNERTHQLSLFLASLVFLPRLAGQTSKSGEYVWKPSQPESSSRRWHIHACTCALASSRPIALEFQRSHCAAASWIMQMCRRRRSTRKGNSATCTGTGLSAKIWTKGSALWSREGAGVWLNSSLRSAAHVSLWKHRSFSRDLHGRAGRMFGGGGILED